MRKTNETSLVLKEIRKNRLNEILKGVDFSFIPLFDKKIKLEDQFSWEYYVADDNEYN